MSPQTGILCIFWAHHKPDHCLQKWAAQTCNNNTPAEWLSCKEVKALRTTTPPVHIKGLLSFQLLLSLSFKQQVLHHTDYINDLLNHFLFLSETAHERVPETAVSAQDLWSTSGDPLSSAVLDLGTKRKCHDSGCWEWKPLGWLKLNWDTE